MSRPLTEVALFAGVGGMMLGLKRAGWQTVAAAEIDAKCQRVLAARFPDTARYGDVTQLSGADLLERHGPVTLLTYTFPCQDLSVAGKRAGLAGERSGLFYEAVRIRRELGCPLSLAENVPGLLSSDGGQDFARCLSALVGAPIAVPSDGWSNSGVVVGDDGICAWTLLDLQHFGPPQRRVRVFLLTAHALGDTGTVVCDPAEVLSLATRLRGDSPQSREAREGSAEAPRVRVASESGQGWWSDEGSVTPLRADPGGMPSHVAYSGMCWVIGCRNVATTPLGICSRCDELNRTTPRYTDHPWRGGVLAFDWTVGTGNPCIGRQSPALGTTKSPAVLAFSAKDSGAHAPLIVGTLESRTTGGGFPGTDGACSGHVVVGTLSPGAHPGALNGQDYMQVAAILAATEPVANAICAREAKGWNPATSVGNGPVSDGIPRRLTPLECVRLMGWPDDHLEITPPLADSTKYRMCGNGVGAPVAEWIGWRLALELAA